MKRTVFVGALVGALAASTAFAQTSGKAGQMPKEGHTAPKPQPMSEPSPTAPDGGMALGTVHIPKAVKADGKQLPAGTYQVRLTPDTASPSAKGQTASLERWAEFVKGGKVQKFRRTRRPTPIPRRSKRSKAATTCGCGSTEAAITI